MRDVTPDDLLAFYRHGIFPMGESRDDPDLYWVRPHTRGVLPLDEFHVSRSLTRTVRQEKFEIRVDTAFEQVMRGCASPEAGRDETWINDTILDLYTALHERGEAHSIECWRDEQLVGGVYGVRMQAAFFAESMFSLARDASKVALVHLVARLRHGGFRLLDTQFTTDHLKRFGARDVQKADYMMLLADALSNEADFYRLPVSRPGAKALQFITQTS